MRGFAAHGLCDVLGLRGKDFGQRFDGDFAANAAVDLKAGVGREVDDLGGVQRFGDFGGEEVGVYPQGFSVGAKGDGRDQRDDLLGDEFEDEIFVDALDFAGEQLVHATDDAEG